MATPFRTAVEALVQEHKQFEDDRMKWEYERTELLNRFGFHHCAYWMQRLKMLSFCAVIWNMFRIAFLERELKSQDKVKIDLAKRVKMLEVIFLSFFMVLFFIININSYFCYAKKGWYGLPFIFLLNKISKKYH